MRSFLVLNKSKKIMMNSFLFHTENIIKEVFYDWHHFLIYINKEFS